VCPLKGRGKKGHPALADRQKEGREERRPRGGDVKHFEKPSSLREEPLFKDRSGGEKILRKKKKPGIAHGHTCIGGEGGDGIRLRMNLRGGGATKKKRNRTEFAVKWGEDGPFTTSKNPRQGGLSWGGGQSELGKKEIENEGRSLGMGKNIQIDQGGGRETNQLEEGEKGKKRILVRETSGQKKEQNQPKPNPKK